MVRRSPLLTPVLTGLILAGLAACSPETDAERSILISADELAGTLDATDLVVLHVARDSAHYEAGHVPGAVFVPLSEIVENRDGLLNVLPDVDHLEQAFRRHGVSDRSRVVVYGDLDGLAASRAFATLDVLGHERVAVLDGGLDAWRAAGHAETTEPADVAPGDFTARFQPELLVSADWINERLGSDDLVLVDARPRAEYEGTEPGTDIQRPGHIPGASSLFWQDSLDDGLFLPADTLAARWSAAGASRDVAVVTYCRTGVQASHAYLTGRLLGYRPLLYDGSFHEWSNLTEYPVARGEQDDDDDDDDVEEEEAEG